MESSVGSVLVLSAHAKHDTYFFSPICLWAGVFLLIVFLLGAMEILGLVMNDRGLVYFHAFQWWL